VKAQIADGVIRTQPEEPFKEAKQAVDLTQAEIIVSVGRGIKEQKNLEMAQKLADALGGEIAASRPICDNGWLPMERQVGSSGQTVAPKLYLALGISGAIQHIVGMKGARTIIAINKDSEAPIFEVSDIGVVGNLFEIVPPLISNRLAEKVFVLKLETRNSFKLLAKTCCLELETRNLKLETVSSERFGAVCPIPIES
jgi:electron transfer flavoprotein alpha subunit